MTTLQHKRNSTSGKVPLASELVPGQIAINTADATAYILNAGSVVQKIADAQILATTVTTTNANQYGILGTSATVSNLDTTFSTGFYYVPSTATGAFPNASAVNSLMIVVNNGAVTGVMQIWGSLAGTFDGSVWMRRYVSGAWSAWSAGYTPLNTTNQLVKTINGKSPDNSGNFQIAAGLKNKFINGRFRVWQRPVPNAGAYTGFIADRWYLSSAGCTLSLTTSTSFPDQSPWFFQWQETSGTGSPYLGQSIENCATNMGQQTTLSIWANPSKTLSFTPQWTQNFGSGGSTAVVTTGTAISMTASVWQLYTQTVTMPSIAGKTVGINSHVAFRLTSAASPGTFTLQLSQFQWEPGANYTGYGYEDLSVTTSQCLFYYERQGNSPWAWTGQLANGSQPQMTVTYQYKRTSTPSLGYLNFSSSGVASGNPTLAEQTNQMTRLNLPAGNVLLGSFGVINFGLTVDSELPAP